MLPIKIKLLHESSRMPQRATPGSGGYDLFADCPAPVEVLPGATTMVPVGFAMELPEGYVALVCARSGMASRHGLAPINGVGVVDSDYRGEMTVPLTCHHVEGYTLRPGERIAQMLIVPVATPELMSVTELSDTDRGSGGFGSTGL